MRDGVQRVDGEWEICARVQLTFFGPEHAEVTPQTGRGAEKNSDSAPNFLCGVSLDS